MPVVKRLVLGKLDILEDGQLQLREDTIIEDDGVEIARLYHRRVLEPTEPVNLPVDAQPLVRGIAPVVWTPAVIAEYRRKQALQPVTIRGNPNDAQA